MMQIHVIKRNHKYFAFNPESLSLFLVPEEVGKILESYESRLECQPENLGGIETDIAKLLNFFEEKNYSDICRSKSWDDRDPKALCLIISHDCNLQC
jgi:hypothetical protein